MPFPYYGFNSYPTQYQPQNNGGIADCKPTFI